MTKNNAMSILNDARNYILLQCSDFINSSEFWLDKNLSAKKGFSDFDNYGNIDYCVVGVQEIENASDDDCFSNYEIMIPLVGMFHEVYGHAQQYMYEYRKNEKLSEVLCLNYFSHQCLLLDNEDYVKSAKDRGEYWKYPEEVAAQYAGIKYAYTYLQQVCPDKANSLICQYVNKRIEANSEFIFFRNGQKYTNIDDILSAFNDRFNELAYAHRNINFDKAFSVQDSAFSEYFKQGYGVKGKEDLCIKFEINGVSQDKMLTYIYLIEEDPNDYIKKNFHALDSFIDVDEYGNRIVNSDKVFPLSYRIKNVKKGEKLSLSDLRSPSCSDQWTESVDLFDDIKDDSDISYTDPTDDWL